MAANMTGPFKASITKKYHSLGSECHQRGSAERSPGRGLALGSTVCDPIPPREVARLLSQLRGSPGSVAGWLSSEINSQSWMLWEMARVTQITELKSNQTPSRGV